MVPKKATMIIAMWVPVNPRFGRVDSIVISPAR
jgi:hypothetical protein